MKHVLVGKVDNGTVAEVAFGFFTGRAAVRRRGDTGEFSFAGPLPMETTPVRGTIDGETVEVVSIAKSVPSPGMIVAGFRLITT